jgi:hypothetical protein
LLAGTTTLAGAGEATAKKGLPLLKVEGNRLKTSQGALVRLQGVNIASLEWTSKGEHVPQSLSVAITEWHANIIRLPLSQDRWFGRGNEQKDGGAAYRKLVQELVQSAAAQQCYLLLDLHWSDAGVWGRNISQHNMPDDNSVAFWEAVASAYANHPAVLFDLYNEPHSVSWEVWRNGGTVSEKNDKAPDGRLEYHTPGMQKLLDACRSQGAKNVIVAGGLDWAYDLSGVVKGYALADPKGNGVVYATHIYPWKKDWDRNVTVVLDTYPVLVGEVGCRPADKKLPARWQKAEAPETWAPKVLSYIEEHQLHWTAWDLHTGAGPSLILDWNYTPTPYWGVPVKKALCNKAGK